MYLQAQLVEQMSKAPTGREHGATGGALSGEGAAARAAEAERRLGSGVQQVLLVVGQVQSKEITGLLHYHFTTLPPY